MNQAARRGPDTNFGDPLRGDAPASALRPHDTLLIVEDEPVTRGVLADVLGGADYSCRTAADAHEARNILAAHDIQLVLTDINMPGESGLDLIRYVRARQPEVALLMVTGYDDAALAETALDVGAYGYVIKPFTANEILIAVANALRRRELEMGMRNQTARLEWMVQQRTSELTTALQDLARAEEELRSSREDTIKRLAMAAEFRDFGTAEHVARMSRYCALLSELHGEPEEKCDLVRVASLMHDVGKIGVPEEVLFKKGSLTAEDWVLMRRHAELGHELLSGSGCDLLDTAATIALTHHERIDGAGYPQGLTGDEIPVEGRIAAVADVFDAVTSDRVYRDAFSVTEARALIEQSRGTHLDAEIVDLMMDAWPRVIAIHRDTTARSA
ncbi:MAG TPA: HD domain-containing phosphohydrolase [Actinomycetota bacterium]|nr:HD domain-containing phosphohydrolase [Actinomycetota bacterium]